MTILKKLGMIRYKHSEIMEYCVQTIRFKKLLEDASALMDLFADGQEKKEGEYILDNHYVTTLIGSMVERLGMIVYDACSLSPDSVETLYPMFDHHKGEAAGLISRTVTNGLVAARTDEAAESSPLAYPEFQLLEHTLEWFDGAGENSVMDLMKLALTVSIQGIERKASFKDTIRSFEKGMAKAEYPIYMVDLWKDAIAPSTSPRSVEDLDSLPLQFLLMDARQAHPGEHGEWVAAVSEHELSLTNLAGNFHFRLDATTSGYRSADYLFVFLDERLSPDKLLPTGFHHETTRAGNLFWKTRVSSTVIEDDLISIGRNLFSETAGAWKELGIA